MRQPVRLTMGRGIGGWGAVAILLLVYALAYVDRQILSLLVAPIRADLAINDTQFSLLHGFSFALFYALFGLPIGRQVDRGHRPLILATGTALWSLFTCLCGLSRNYWQLFLFRMGVGIGEATVVPVTYSLLGDYFQPERRGLAMGLFGSGIYLGMGAALLIGAALIGALEAAGPVNLTIVGTLRPWQLALVVVGLPGLPIALLTLLLLEPRFRQDQAARPPRTGSTGPSARAHYRRHAAAILLHHLVVTFMVMSLYAILAWAPELFRRSFGLEPSASGLSIGLIVIAAGTLGVVGGGVVSDALVRRGVRAARLQVLLASALCAIPSALWLALAPSSTAALAALGATILFLSPLSSVGPAALQDLFPPALRGTGAAVYQLVANLIGLSLGPTAVAVVTDRVFADDARLDASLSATLPVMLAFAVIFCLLGLKPFQRATEELAAARVG